MALHLWLYGVILSIPSRKLKILVSSPVYGLKQLINACFLLLSFCFIALKIRWSIIEDNWSKRTAEEIVLKTVFSLLLTHVSNSHHTQQPLHENCHELLDVKLGRSWHDGWCFLCSGNSLHVHVHASNGISRRYSDSLETGFRYIYNPPQT